MTHANPAEESYQQRFTNATACFRWLGVSSVRRLHRPKFRTLLWTLLSTHLLAAAFDLGVCIASPCGVREVGSREALEAGRCVDEFYLVYSVRMAITLLSLLCLTLHFLWKSSRLWRSYNFRTLQKRDAWVAAASPDVFRETDLLLKGSNQMVGFLLLPFAVCLITTQILNIFARRVSADDVESIKSRCNGNTGVSFAACDLCSRVSNMFVLVNAILLIAIVAPIHTLPECLWSRAMARAQKQIGSRRMQYLLTPLPWICALAYLSLAAQLLLHVHFMAQHGAPVWEAPLVLVIEFGTAAFLSFVAVARARIPQDVADLIVGQLLPRFIRSVSVVGRSLIPSKSTAIINDASSSSNLTQMSRTEDSTSLLLSSPVIPAFDLLLYSIQCYSESGLGQNQEVLLLIQQLLWSYRVISGTFFFEMIIILLLRGIGLGALFLSVDKQCGFSELQENNQGFGLLADADDLRSCIRRCILEHKKALAPPKLYKATLFRMQETLAVSYRWQREEVELTPGCSLNMKAFQLNALSDAILSSGARYVWLDRLSVPQGAGGNFLSLQKTLLARMMGVYASASHTLVLRSVEEEGSRYHQRAWTFQEFCCARQLSIVTEQGGTSGSERVAIQSGEDEQFKILRQQFQERGDLVPFWLRCLELKPGEAIMSPEQAKDVLVKYTKISAQLHSLLRGDMVRALIPLLSDCPVESQAELVNLVTHIGQAAGKDVHNIKSDLFDLHMYNSRETLDRSSHRSSQGKLALSGRFRPPVSPPSTNLPGSARHWSVLQGHDEAPAERYSNFELSSTTAMMSHAKETSPANPSSEGQLESSCGVINIVKNTIMSRYTNSGRMNLLPITILRPDRAKQLEDKYTLVGSHQRHEHIITTSDIPGYVLQPPVGPI